MGRWLVFGGDGSLLPRGDGGENAIVGEQFMSMMDDNIRKAVVSVCRCRHDGRCCCAMRLFIGYCLGSD